MSLSLVHVMPEGGSAQVTHGLPESAPLAQEGTVRFAESVQPALHMRRARPVRWLAPLVRAFAELYEVERLRDLTLTVRIRSRQVALVQVRRSAQAWFVMVCADDTVYRASPRNGPLYPWVVQALGCCPYGKLGCSDGEHAEVRQSQLPSVEIVYTRIRGAWRHAACFEARPYAA